jgi:hypothetical protein
VILVSPMKVTTITLCLLIQGETTRSVQCHGVHVCCCSNHGCAECGNSSASGVC